MKNFTLIIAIFGLFIQNTSAQKALTPEALLSLKYVSGAALSPDGSQVVYTVSIPRNANEAPGTSHKEIVIKNLKDGSTKLLFDLGYGASNLQWFKDGKRMAYLHKDDNGVKQVWIRSIESGEDKMLTNSSASISDYKLNPTGMGLAFIVADQASDKEKELKKRGYGFIFYEENIKFNNLFYVEVDENGMAKKAEQLTRDMQVWNFVFNAQGTQIAAGISPENLVDHKYMFQKVHVINLADGSRKEVSKNEGKLGNYVFSPDGSKLAYAATFNKNDHQISQAYVLNLKDGAIANYTPENYKGHVTWVNWKNDKDLIYHADEGVNTMLYSVALKNKKRKLLLDGKEAGIVFKAPDYTSNFKTFVFSGSTPTDYVNLYSWTGKGELKPFTNVNPELADAKLAEQKVIEFEARDGLKIEGILMLPNDYQEGTKYPLIVYVHGGPESHHTNSWLSAYSTPGQVMAGKGYMVAYFNYRASTGYGVEFSMKGFGDPAGKEFDDIADGIDYLVANHGADGNRVGLAGGSYGGFASAWFATYYTDKVKAVAMFVGLSNLISKKGTTDIPNEEIFVHAGATLEETWDLNLKRSPIYYAHQSKTATLIYGGAADTRVHPSQSMELYRRMKVNGHPAVRLVQYPGEGHGNRKQVGRIDVLYRQMTWFDWYVRDLKPLNGEMPPLDLSDYYGLDW